MDTQRRGGGILGEAKGEMIGAGGSCPLTHVFVLDDATEVLRVFHEAGEARVILGARRVGPEVHEAQGQRQVVLSAQDRGAWGHEARKAI